MKVVIAPNAFKGSLTARQVAQAMAAAVVEVVPHAHTIQIPVADGGDGLIDVLADAFAMRRVTQEVQGPLTTPVAASFLYSEAHNLAVIEMAAAAGLHLLAPTQLDPMHANTYGVGELIRSALDLGAKQIILGLGGSATVDAGMGLVQALGAQFFDRSGTALAAAGAALIEIERIDLTQLDRRLTNCVLRVACDVDHLLTGLDGAAAVFGPQKGADAQQVAQLDAGLGHLAMLIKRDLGIDVLNLVGGGAAGGMGAGLVAFCAADLCSGAELVLDLLEVERQLAGADLVLTGEGRLDVQTCHGKAPAALAKLAKRYAIPCIAINGSVDTHEDVLTQTQLTAAFSLCPGPMSEQEAIKSAEQYVTYTTRQVLGCYLAGLPIHSQQDRVQERKIMIRKCLFPAAGYGTRFLPATKAMPKEVLPVVDKPLIQYGVEEAMDAGMKNIAIITGRGKRAIEDHFDISYELEHQISGTSKEDRLGSIRQIIEQCTFSYTRQIEMRGLGHAILTGETLIGNEPFGVILADDLCVGNKLSVMAQMIKIYEKYRCSILAIEEVDPQEVSKYGVIEGQPLDDDIFMVSSMVEKPEPDEAPSNLAIIGRYILTPDIFDILRHTPPGKNGELQITDALQTQAKDNMVLAYKFDGQRFDCGKVDGFVEATNYFFKLRKNGAQ